MTTTVVNLRNGIPPGAVYIGRANPSRGLPASPYANPFKIGADGTREEVIDKYKQWFLNQSDLKQQARRELTGKVLACWCAPLDCHGRVLAEYVDAARAMRESLGLSV